MQNTEILSPRILGAQYTEYYETEKQDSPDASISRMVNLLIPVITERLRSAQNVIILDVGSGRQILEQALFLDRRFKSFSSRVKIISMDIASLTKKQLFEANRVTHIQACGSSLPIANHTVDIAVSNLALDLMPQASFGELKRVIKPDGSVVLTFHHPNLIEIAKMRLPLLLHNLRTVVQKLRHGKNSSKLGKYHENREIIQRQLVDTQFIINSFANLIFQSKNEIYHVLKQMFPEWRIKVEENFGEADENGWFEVMLIGPEKKQQQSHPTASSVVPAKY